MACALAAQGSPAGAATLIVLDKNEASAWLLDPKTGDVRAKLEVGNGPHEAAVSPDGTTAVVCNYGLAGQPRSTLTVIDLSSRRVTKTISLAPHERPHGIAYHEGGAEVLVTSETSRAILRVDVAAGNVVAVHDVGVDAHLLAVSGDGASVYGAGTEAIAVRPGQGEIWVGSNDLDRISIVDPISFRIVAEIPCGLTPIRLAFTHDGKRALASCAVVDLETWTIARRIPTGAAPDGMAWSELG